MKGKNANQNKSIHKFLYDLQTTPKEEYINVTIVWVPLCTDVHTQTLLMNFILFCYHYSTAIVFYSFVSSLSQPRRLFVIIFGLLLKVTASS